MTFAALLAPMTVDEFADRCWNRAAHLLPRRAGRFTGLAFDVDALRRELQLTATPVRAQYFDAAGNHHELAIQPSQIDDCLRAGMTICVVDVDAFLPRLAAQSRALLRSLRTAAMMNFSFYWSAAGGGFGLHYDNHPVFICQLEGRKHWSYTRTPAVREPRINCVHSADAVAVLRASGIDVRDPDDLEQVVLEPGDMLYLPAGTWHQTRAVDGESRALTLRVFEGTADYVLHHALQTWTDRDEQWRRQLPLVESKGSDFAVPRPIEAILGEQLGRLKDFVSKLELSDLVRTWSELQARAAVRAVQPSTIEPGDRIAVRDCVRVLRARGADGRDCLYVYTGTAELELPAGDAWLEQVIGTGSFVAGEACAWGGAPATWDETRHRLDELVADGVVDIEPQGIG